MITLFSFGASTAEGQKDPDGGGFIGRIGTRLKAQNMGHSLNYGIGGETTDAMIPRLSTLPNIQKDHIAIISLGINDVQRIHETPPNKRVDLTRHEKNVETIIRNLKNKCRVLYTSQYPVKYAEKDLDPTVVQKYIQTGLTVAKNQNVLTLDIFSLVDEARFQKYIHNDGIHFNSEGHEFMAQQIWNFLTKNQMLSAS